MCACLARTLNGLFYLFQASHAAVGAAEHTRAGRTVSPPQVGQLTRVRSVCRKTPAGLFHCCNFAPRAHGLTPFLFDMPDILELIAHAAAVNGLLLMNAAQWWIVLADGLIDD